MIKLIVLFLMSFSVFATSFTDIKFGQSQIADSQWNVSACMYTSTCQIYSKAPGTAYKIPWTSGRLSWATGDYVAFVATGNTANPWQAIQYNSSGVQKAVMGNGHIINMGTNYLFFVGYDNNTGQLFSPTTGMNSSAGVTWTGTLNPSVSQLNTAASSWTTAPLSPGQTYTAVSSLCCGGSSSSFTANTTNTSKVNTFITRTSGDDKVTVEQIGSTNSIIIDQSGTPNNYTKYYSNGDYNSTTISQSSSSTSATNYTELSLVGSNNNISLTQQSSGGIKSAFVDIANNNNSVTLLQKDNGNHYADITLSGGNKTVDVSQQGSGSHQASVTLSGQPSSLNLIQRGSSTQFYSINFNCATSGGCVAIQVQQGQ